MFATAVDSQFPDLVDKPLTHQFGMLPSGPSWAGVDGINGRLWTAFSVVALAVTLIVVMRDIRREVRNPRV